MPKLKIREILPHNRELGVAKGLFVRCHIGSNRNELPKRFEPPSISDRFACNEHATGFESTIDLVHHGFE